MFQTYWKTQHGELSQSTDLLAYIWLFWLFIFNPVYLSEIWDETSRGHFFRICLEFCWHCAHSLFIHVYHACSSVENKHCIILLWLHLVLYIKFCRFFAVHKLLQNQLRVWNNNIFKRPLHHDIHLTGHCESIFKRNMLYFYLSTTNSISRWRRKIIKQLRSPEPTRFPCIQTNLIRILNQWISLLSAPLIPNIHNLYNHIHPHLTNLRLERHHTLNHSTHLRLEWHHIPNSTYLHMEWHRTPNFNTMPRIRNNNKARTLLSSEVNLLQ